MSRVTVERVAGRRLEIRTQEAVAIVDRAVEDGGGGDGFRSVDLLLGALGACTIGTMLGVAEAHGIEVGEVRADLSAVTSLATDRVTRVKLTLHLGSPVGADDLERLRAPAEGCKVHQSLHDGIPTQLTVINPDSVRS
jgi:uncharacterized OsmC-like protein